MQILLTVLELFHPHKGARRTVYNGNENTPKNYSVILQTRFNCEISGFRRQVDASALFWAVTQRAVVILQTRFNCETSGFRRQVDESALFWAVTQRAVVILQTRFNCEISGFRRQVDASALFSAVTQLLIPYRRSGTIYRPHLRGSRIFDSWIPDPWKLDRQVVPKRQ
jgi:hypothetical protein